MWSWPLFACFLQLLVPEVACQYKMVLIYGSVSSDATSISTTFTTVEDCTNGCFGSESCIIAYFSFETCVFYNYVSDGKTITVEENSKEAYVAIKTNISNIPNGACPASYNDLKLSVTSAVGEKNSWTRTSTGWKMSSCKTDWKRFERDDNGTIICMKVFPFLEEGGERAGIKRCQQENVTLSGIASMEEAEWVREYAMTSPRQRVFIGGERDCPDTPCTTFKWTDGYTKSYEVFSNAEIMQRMNGDSQNCLVIRIKAGTDAIIFSQSCPVPSIPSVCGYKIDV